MKTKTLIKRIIGYSILTVVGGFVCGAIGYIAYTNYELRSLVYTVVGTLAGVYFILFLRWLLTSK